jgi:uncharacterized membrane protein
MGSAGWGFGAAFLGSAVESVEALTIVLAVGVTRGWRAPLQGMVAALIVLAVVVLSLGQLLTTRVPQSVLKSVIGGLVLLFGLRWLHKAILRSAGLVALSDENLRYAKTAQGAGVAARLAGVDWPGFAVAFKGVFLEGLEVAFIVFAVAASTGQLGVAGLGGLAAVVCVAVLGVVLRRPLTRVPENTIKHAVGVLLASLGTFWAGEGFGVRWPFDAVSVLALVALYLGADRLSIALLRAPARSVPASKAA